MDSKPYYERDIVAPRIQYPRSSAPVGPLARETCRTGFPTGPYKYKHLAQGARAGKYFFLYGHSLQKYPSSSEFYLDTAGLSKASDGFIIPYITNEETKILTTKLAEGIPYLGTITLRIAEAGNHVIPFLLRKKADMYEMFLFETYDTSAVFFDNNNAWIDILVNYLKLSIIPNATIKYTRMVSKETNLQKDDLDGKGRCVMWALVFLYKLSLIPDLKNATEADLKKIYDDLEKNIDTIQSIIYGARRIKTTRRRGKKSTSTRKTQTKKGHKWM
jgi:hypothetical protein